MRPNVLPVAAGFLVLATIVGCSAPKPPNTGFISDYSRLQPIKSDAASMRYVSEKLRGYDQFIIDPIQLSSRESKLSPEQRAEVARYLHESMVRVCRDGGIRVTDKAGVGVARLRIALTSVHESKWYLNLHPATKVTGAGRAGATMEAEIVDSVTGEQLGAAIRSGRGRDLELNPFSTINDVKNVIDQWAETATARLRELRASGGAPPTVSPTKRP